MSTTTSYDHALHFLPSGQVRSRRQGFVNTIRVIAGTMREGHLAAGRYQELRSRGVTHDEAARLVFAEVYAAR